MPQTGSYWDRPENQLRWELVSAELARVRGRCSHEFNDNGQCVWCGHWK